MINIQAESAELVGFLADKCSRNEPLGSMSESVYDTAWVSMVHKPIESEQWWLFPQSFQYVLDQQSSEGGWERSNNAATDDVHGILSTMACLLSIIRHRNKPEIHGCQVANSDLDARIQRAVTWLKLKLDSWDVNTSEHVAFEILIPTHVALLHAEGLELHFQGSNELQQINAIKMDKFDARVLYGSTQTTLIHSLEAFIGRIDFDRISHRLVKGSMMYSPSSTAAYLIYASVWDERAEEYLKMVLDKAEACGKGAVPSAYPSDIFDISWVLSTLLGAGFTPEDLGKSQIELLGDHLSQALSSGGGVVGFTSNVMPDADDTAKSISSLHLLGRPVTSLDPLIKTFKTKSLFQTYHGERNGSFSANCNVLVALLQAHDQHTKVICEVVEHLCTIWMSGSVKDKWNSSEQYSYLLLSQGLTMTLSLWDQGLLPDLSPEFVLHQVALVMAQLLSRTILNQQPDGSWGSTIHESNSCEVTAYGILTLKTLSSLPFLESMASEMQASIDAGRHYLFLNHDRWKELSYIWIEKVTYGSAVLAQAYCLAALHDTETRTWKGALAELVCPPMHKAKKFIGFFSFLPLFSHLSGNPTIKLSILEGYLLLPQLKARRLDIFPRKDMAEDKWLEYIPFTWTCCNYLNKPVKTQLLTEMMILSMLNYQADEFMEAVVGVRLQGQETILQQFIIDSCMNTEFALAPLETTPPGTNGSQNNGTTEAHATGKMSFETLEAKRVLKKYISHILTHTAVLRAPIRTQNRLRHELASFLCAHITQNCDNMLFSKQLEEEKIQQELRTQEPFKAANSSFYQWVHTTSANHTSGPFSWIFYECLISTNSKELWKGPRTAYLAEDVGRRLSTMCRMYNDYGSAKRDRAEANVNSLDFPEFYDQEGTEIELEEREREEHRKDNLMYLAEYERCCLNSAMKRLGELANKELMNRVQLFVNVTDFYGQIYVARDIASRMK